MLGTVYIVGADFSPKLQMITIFLRENFDEKSVPYIAGMSCSSKVYTLIAGKT